MKRFVGTFLVLLTASALLAAEPQIVRVDSAGVTVESMAVPANKIVRLTIKDAPPEAVIVWDVGDEERCDLDELDPTYFRFTGPEGSYKVKASVVAGKKKQVLRAVITIGKAVEPPPAPKVDPIPPPKPLPGPMPVASKLWLIVIEDNPLARTPAQARVLSDKAFWDSVNSSGHRWYVYKADSPNAVKFGYTEKAKAKGLPAIVITDDQFHYLDAIPLPNSVDEISNKVKSLTGK